ncbi:MAG: DUF927 domain-containing protein [bacterium]|nr:DUF927 domain-containing protein [bacterium]
MKPLNHMTASDVLSDDVLSEVFDQEDELYKSRLLLSLEDRAGELGVKRKFQELVKAYRRVEREIKRQQNQKSKVAADVPLMENWTSFTGPYERMRCRTWIASDSGIYQYNPNPAAPDLLACYHPILPIERLKNLETGEEQIKLAYKRSGKWEEIIVPKTMITSANKIVSLSARGVAVTSENAKHLVRYLSDVENLNDESIMVQYSSSKLGWIRGGFLPYDTDIIFDGDSRFKAIFDSIGEHGDRNRWFEYVSGLRRTGRMEIKFLLAASFSSVLIGLLGALPYIMDLWGETEGGKTVTLMLAASVWADPAESRYIGDFKTTDVALEAKADMLNHLPMILDDTSKTSSRIRENFEGVVYDLCSGKGKSRSNKDLGINRENRWSNCILTNGERPLTAYVNQGGAINRILEVECGEKVYKDPQETAELLKQHYGFAGKEFVSAVQEMGIDKVRKIQKELQKKLMDDEKMQKQAISLSIVLTADKIATERLFRDGQYISIDEAKEVLIDRSELSDNERCYQYILDKVAMNPARFDEQNENIEKWGVIENGYAIIYTTAFTALCRDGGFSRPSFLSWANRKGIIQPENSGKRLDKLKSFKGNKVRCVFLKLNDNTDKEGFVTVEGEENLELPFR